jgi:hypothetical protein
MAMSDTSHGQGWWLATDGKWYPPTSLAHLPPPPVLPAPPEAYAERPGPPLQPGKPFYKTPWMILVAIGAVILVIGVVAFAHNVANNQATSSSSAPPSSSSYEPGLNEPALDGNFAFVVTGVHCGVYILGSDPLTTSAPSGSEWCLVSMSVRADKSQSQDFFASNQYAIDAQGRQLSADTNALIYMSNDSDAEDTTVNPGITIHVVVPFQIEYGDHITSFDLHDSDFSSGVTVRNG